ncbi:CoA transferase subunit A [Nesterenkonia natronophila]|uniref:CoA transferase subunit A n=1 Tax=Nesterenkonia natronophila TaxID=2174932 RepID=A0A3A4F5L9_9MICC|nr:CoA transferase subunit A [Nesterenkonia natronophila]RJN33036.1 CoA transferase subunit A [Nesterenkonia natronophila]
MSVDKSVASAEEAVADIPDGASLAVGGFGLSGNPIQIIEALLEQGATDLTIASNNAGVDGWGLGKLLESGRIRKMISSYVGENKEFARQYLEGELELELVPQGTLAEKLRAGGAGIPAFYTRAGVGTPVADGGIPTKYDAQGNILEESGPKEVRPFRSPDGQTVGYALEESIMADFSLVHAARGDRHGNLVFNQAARQFSPPAAMAGRICIAQVEELVEPGQIDPDAVHLPGIYVHRILEVGAEIDKPIEKRTVRTPAKEEEAS